MGRDGRKVRYRRSREVAQGNQSGAKRVRIKPHRRRPMTLATIVSNKALNADTVRDYNLILRELYHLKMR